VLTVACVLRSGGEYRPEHVQALAEGVKRHMPKPKGRREQSPYRFVCLSDVPVPGVPVWPIRPDFPGWWSKLRLFSPGGLYGRCLYLDLDSIVVGDLSEIAAYDGPFAMLSDFYRPERPASGVMAWDADDDAPRAIWDAWMRDPEGHMHTYQGGGDQEFIRSVVGDGVDRLQDHAPGAIVSYKVHVVPNGGVPDGARLVCGHGRPRPWDPEWRL
jgi:hypothetical protein